MTYHGDNAEQKGSGKQIMSEQDNDDGGLPNTGIVTKTRPKTKKPSMYKVLLLNDDYTPMEFVVQVLERFFEKGRETKVNQVMDLARQNQHPLQCTLEKE